MQISYSKHALERLRNRNILRKEVEEALIKGQTRKIQSSGTIKCEYNKSGKKLVVIYEQRKDKFKIITAYKL